MEHSRLPDIGMCIGCGETIPYSPVRMPLKHPIINPEKPGHYAIEYGVMCLQCVRAQLPALIDKVVAGEMYPVDVWDVDADGNYSIVSLDSGAVTLPESKIPTDHGRLRQVLNWIWSFVY